MAQNGKAPSEELFQARTSFSTTLDGEVVVIQQGQLVDAHDPIRKGREQLFKPAALNVRQYKTRRPAAPKVERATAAPGEQRS